MPIFTDANTAYAVCDWGTILKTIDAGNTWTLLWSGTDFRLYSVCFTDDNTGYAVGDNCIILKTTTGGYGNSVEETISPNTLFTVFPNPACNNITISFKKGLTKDMCVSIFDINGKQVMHKVSRNQNLVEFDVSTLPAGMYLLKIRTGEGIEVKKLIIQ